MFLLHVVLCLFVVSSVVVIHRVVQSQKVFDLYPEGVPGGRKFPLEANETRFSKRTPLGVIKRIHFPTLTIYERSFENPLKTL